MTAVAAISMETTGLDPSKDAIIRLSASLLRGGAVADHFAEPIHTTLPVSPAISSRTGITGDDLAAARKLDAVLSDFLAFLPEDALLVAHNGTFARAFLHRASQGRFARSILDTRELSAIAFPGLPAHGLETLREALDLGSRVERSETVLTLWQHIVARCQTFPPALLQALGRLLAPLHQHPYRAFFKQLERNATSATLAATPLLRELIRRDPPPKPRPPADDNAVPVLLDEEEVSSMFGPVGEFAMKLPGYEHREGQVDMTRHVVQALNGRQHLFVEAGTGIGKSLAYLLPAVIWSTENNVPVVISTNTKNLQSQLFEKDLPLLRQVLERDFNAALIKGRTNYLCLRKLFYLLEHADLELEKEDRLRLAAVLSWALHTGTGDVSEHAAWERAGLHGLAARLTSTGEECLGRACKECRLCFLRQARAKALAADIVVANHSLVFAEMGIKSPALPPYAHVIFDEAHNLEHAATQHFSVEVSSARIRFILRRLRRSKRHDTGLLRSIKHHVTSGAAPAADEHRERVLECSRKLSADLETLDATVEAFFGSLQGFLGNKADSLRIHAEKKKTKVWEPIDRDQKGLIIALTRIVSAADDLTDALRDMDADSLPFSQVFIKELEAISLWIKEATTDIDFVLRAQDDGFVYWVEAVGRRHRAIRAWAAPLSVAEKLATELYADKDTIIFSSATLSIRGSFNFLRKRLGVSQVDPARLLELQVGTPFDYRQQCLVMVPMFLPEPTDADGNYEQELALLLANVFRRTHGRALSLFTSYRMLKATTTQLRDALTGDAIQILAQGITGSRDHLMQLFKQDLGSVLMGTHSFWEGVDVVGEALSCLVIARLPFAVFTDPIVEARCEQVEAAGESAFMGYSLPSAVIRFRQGFGRLLRRRTDRGIVIVTDRRIVSKRYGSWFQKSLPVPCTPFTDRDSFLQAVEQFVEDEYC